MAFKILGQDQAGLYERVTINRKEKSVAVDRMDGNWWHAKPFIGRRDLFYIENRDGTSHADGQLTFVRHEFWLSTMHKFSNQFASNFSSWSYKRAFAATPSTN